MCLGGGWVGTKLSKTTRTVFVLKGLDVLNANDKRLWVCILMNERPGAVRGLPEERVFVGCKHKRAHSGIRLIDGVHQDATVFPVVAVNLAKVNVKRVVNVRGELMTCDSVCLVLRSERGEHRTRAQCPHKNWIACLSSNRSLEYSGEVLLFRRARPNGIQQAECRQSKLDRYKVLM